MGPRKSLAIVTCMDPRLTALLEQNLGLSAGDAFIIRNAGALVTSDIIRSLSVATCHMGVTEIIIVGHTDCGMAKVTPEDLQDSLSTAGISKGVLSRTNFNSWIIKNESDNVLIGIKRVKCSPYIPNSISVKGFLMDIDSGCLSPIEEKRPA